MDINFVQVNRFLHQCPPSGDVATG